MGQRTQPTGGGARPTRDAETEHLTPVRSWRPAPSPSPGRYRQLTRSLAEVPASTEAAVLPSTSGCLPVARCLLSAQRAPALPGLLHPQDLLVEESGV